MSIPLNSGRNPIDNEDAEGAIKGLAEINGDSELLKNLCFAAMLGFEIGFVLLIVIIG